MKKIILTICMLIAIKAAFSQASNVNLVSKWIHGTDFTGISVSGNYAYCLTTDSVMYILDVSNPTSSLSSIRAVSQVLLNHSINYDIDVVNSKAYIAELDSGLEIVDVSNPYLPVKMGKCLTTGMALKVKVLGNYAYVAADTAGLRIIDVSNPNTPFEVGHYDIGNTRALDVDISGNYAFIAYGNSGFQIVDVSNPAAPVSAGFLPFSNVFNVGVSGNHAYIIDGTPGELKIINIANVSVPVLEGSTTGAYLAQRLFVSGNYVYTVSSLTNYNLRIYDVSNPLTPVYAGSYGNSVSSSISQCIFVNGTTVYYVSREPVVPGTFASMRILDATVPNAVTLIGKYMQPDHTEAVCASGQYVYVGGRAGTGKEMISVIDISNPSYPQNVNTYIDTVDAIGLSASFLISGNYLYCIGARVSSCGTFGFKIIDINNPLSMSQTGEFCIAGASCVDLAISGNYAYGCFYSTGFVVIDISNLAVPVQVTSLILSGGFPPSHVAIAGSYAYVTDNADKLHIIDISNPASPSEVGLFQLLNDGTDVYAEGNYVYVAEGSQGFQIINVSVPSSPSLVGGYTSVSTAAGLHLHKQGNFVYLSDFSNGLQVVDVSNPASPVQSGYFYSIASYVRDVFADSLHTYLTAGEGLYIFNGAGITGTQTAAGVNNQLSIFPNPCTNEVTVQCSQFPVEIKMFDLVGNNVFSQQLKTSSSTFQTENLAKGVYFLEVITDKGREVKKVLKQ